MLIQGQFGIIQNLRVSPISQTSLLSWTFFAVSYSKMALGTVPSRNKRQTKYCNYVHIVERSP